MRWPGRAQPATPARPYTLFSQGGYGRDLDLYIDPQGRLSARIALAPDQILLVQAQEALAADQDPRYE